MKTLKSLGKKKIDEIRKKAIRTYHTTVGVITWEELAEKMRELYEDKTEREMAVYICGYLHGIEHEREMKNKQMKNIATGLLDRFKNGGD